MTTDEKFNALKESLHHMERVIIAYSGGVDSTFLLKAASLSGLKDILAVTSASNSLPKEELDFSKEMTSSLDIRHKIIETEELQDENYSNNPPDRCYYCKKELFGSLRSIAKEDDFSFILDGTNADDKEDWRPGRRAAFENGVHSPLLDAGFSKSEIRDISRALGLPTWDKPATPCLSSRFPYGEKITAAGLERVELAENFIRQFGFKELRVRDHAGTARIEIISDDFKICMMEEVRPRILSYLKSLGYKYITLDLQGFRSGSMNESIKKPKNLQVDSL
ncbi:MAG: ATP-dependent sacrificial sulfur transferase LarE [Nitrospirae bacterium]|nr:ATP-dependent sacrificial sulfur transferase LarE [Nitrospirota bacterium]